MSQLIEPLEHRQLYSASLPAGAHLVFDDFPSGIAGQREVLTANLETQTGTIIPVSGMTVHFSLANGSSASSLGSAKLQNGVARVDPTLPRAGRYRIAVSAGGRSAARPFVVQGGTAARMRLTGAAFMDNGEEGFEFRFTDRFGNLATSDTSALTFTVSTPTTYLAYANVPTNLEGVILENGNGVGVHVGNIGPGYALIDIVAGGYQPGGPAVSIAVIFHDSNPAVPAIASRPWLAAAD